MLEIPDLSIKSRNAPILPDTVSSPDQSNTLIKAGLLDSTPDQPNTVSNARLLHSDNKDEN